MPRLLGVDIPSDRPTVISLTYLYGVGHKTARELCHKAESIRRFAVLEGDFTEENGYLTPSMKLKRNVVLKDYHEDVEALYA